MDANKINDLELSCEGISRMINNDWRSCEELFAQYKCHLSLTKTNPKTNLIIFHQRLLAAHELLLDFYLVHGLYQANQAPKSCFFVSLISQFQFKKALMSFEENLMDQAAKDLDETEKLCTPNGPSKMASAIRKAFGMSRNNSSSRWRNVIFNVINLTFGSIVLAEYR